MTELNEDNFVTLGNMFGTAAQRLKDQVNEAEGIITSLQQELIHEREQSTAKDTIIADQRSEIENIRNKLDDISGDYGLHDGTLIQIQSLVRERLERKRRAPEEKKSEEHPLRLTGAMARSLPPDLPIPRVVTRGPAAVAG